MNNKYQVALIFAKTARNNRWVYQSPVIYKDNIGNISKKKFYTIPCGKMKGTIIKENQLLEMKDSSIIKKYKSSKHEEIRLNGNADSNSNILFVTIGTKLKDEIYDDLGHKLGTDLSEKDFLDYLVLYAHKMGKSIESLEKQSLAGYSIIKKENSIDNISIEKKEIYLMDDFVYDKSKEEKMEASYSYPNAYSVKKVPYNNVQQVNTKKVVPKLERNAVDKDKSKDNDLEHKERFEININPVKIKEEIRKKVMCQDTAIDMIVNNIYINQKMIQSGDKDRIRQKSTILLDGPTGTGKTFIIRETTEKMGLPYVLAPSTSFSTTGYKGSDLTDILIKLLDKSNGDIALAQRGIIVIDEFDKLGVSDGDKELAIRKGMQHELLTFIEVAKYDVEYEGQKYEFDTSKITFIALGAFTNLRERKIVENEKNNKQTLGFNTSTNSKYNRVYTITADDYIDEGIGR